MNSAPDCDETQFEQGSGGSVLKNLLGIAHPRAMDQEEFAALYAAQLALLPEFSEETRFTAQTIRRMHFIWLGGVYPWAGQYRTVGLSKGNFSWPPPQMVSVNMANLEAGLLRTHTPCRPGPIEEVARRIAEVHADLLLIHPFREGNGRISRWLADLMAMQAGFPAPDYGFEGRVADERMKIYLDGVRNGAACDYAPLADFFADSIRRSLSSNSA